MTKYNYGKKMRKIVLGVTIIASLSTTACERSKNIYTNGSKSAKENVSEKTYHTMNEYGAQISVKDVKDKYKYQDETLMPLYNVEEDECFDFEISKSLASKIRNKYDLDVVTVHTDSKCLKESAIHIERTVSNKDKKIVLNIAPNEIVLMNNTQMEDRLDHKHLVWGNAPIYYIAIHYDLQADKLVKLENPIIIPFTIRQMVQPPNVKASIDEKGCFKLSWNKIEGAEKYRIYHRIGDKKDEPGKKNPPPVNAEGAYREYFLSWVNDTTDTEFSDFGFTENGQTVSKPLYSEKEYVIQQNYGVSGEYYVSAIIDGKESGFQQGIPTSDLILPSKIDDNQKYHLENTKIENVNDLPLSLDVENIDGSISKRNVLYTYEFEDKHYTGKQATYNYCVEGTALTGKVTMAEPEQNYPETIGQFKDNGNSKPQNNIEKIPNETVTNLLDDKSDKDDESLLSKLKRCTQEHVKKGNESSIKNPNNEEIVFADNAEEEWLALNLINAQQKISVEAFPKLQDPNMLEDVFNKVYNQNPYIIGVYGFDYDYSNMILNVEYLYDQNTIYQKQSEVYQEGVKIKNSIIKEDMSEDEKRLTLYQYLETNCTYDNEALAQCKTDGYVKTKDNTYEDSFNAYGVIVKKKGVCQSFSYAYKLLCSLSGIESRVVTGYLNGSSPHSWNAVKIGGEWFQIDCTNNGISTGIPYFLYNADTDTAKETGYISDKLYELDSKLSEFEAKNSQYEYYHSIGCVADSVNSYQEVLDKELVNNKEVVCIRYTGSKPNKDDLIKVVKAEYNKHGLENELSQVKYIEQNGYITLKK